MFYLNRLIVVKLHHFFTQGKINDSNHDVDFAKHGLVSPSPFEKDSPGERLCREGAKHLFNGAPNEPKWVNLVSRVAQNDVDRFCTVCPKMNPKQPRMVTFPKISSFRGTLLVRKGGLCLNGMRLCEQGNRLVPI